MDGHDDSDKFTDRRRLRVLWWITIDRVPEMVADDRPLPRCARPTQRTQRSVRSHCLRIDIQCARNHNDVLWIDDVVHALLAFQFTTGVQRREVTQRSSKSIDDRSIEQLHSSVDAGNDLIPPRGTMAHHDSAGNAQQHTTG